VELWSPRGPAAGVLCGLHDLLRLIQVGHVDPELDGTAESHATSLADTTKARSAE
jgi:hypothetical protein